jgi:hypothetical protein
MISIRLSIIFIAIFLFSSIPTKSQFIYQTSFGNLTHQEGWGKSVILTSDSCYLFGGTLMPSSIVGNELLLLKTGLNGSIIWKKIYGCGLNEIAYKVKETNDGGFIVAANSGVIAGEWHSYLIKTDSNGDTIWTRTYWENYDDERINDVCETPDSGYIFAGDIYSQFGSTGMYLMKTDGYGNLIWTKSFNGTRNAVSICPVSDGYLLLGNATISSANSDLLLMKVNFNGDSLWTKSYGGMFNDYPSQLQASDNGFVLIGSTYSFGFGLWDIYLAKIDSVGNLIWSKTYGSGNTDNGTSVIQTSDGGFIATGTRESSNVDKALLFKTDNAGNVSWAKTYSNVGETYAYSVISTPDNGYILTGKGDDGILSMIKTDAVGNSGCNQQSITLGSLNAPFVQSFPIISMNMVNAIDFGGLTTAGSGGTFHTQCLSLNADEPNEKNFKINIFPNPATTYLSIKTENLTISSIEIFNILGNKLLTLKSSNISENRFEFDIPEFPASIYIIKILTEKGILERKLIIQ